MQSFNEFLGDKNLVEAIVESGCDIDALCNGLLGLAKQDKFTEEAINEAWFGIPQAARAVAGGLGGVASGVGGDVGRGLGRAGGWLGRKALHGAQAVGGAAANAGRAVGRGIGAAGNAALSGIDALGQGAVDAATATGRGIGAAGRAVGGAAAGAGRAVGGAAAGAGRAVGGYIGDKYQQGVQQQAAKQVRDRLVALYGDLAALGYDKAMVQRMLTPIQQALRDRA